MSGKITLAPNKLKEVMANWEHLKLPETIARVVEFFNDLPMRASANIQHGWLAGTEAAGKAARHGFALLTHFNTSGHELNELMRNRGRARDAGRSGPFQKMMRKYGINVKPVSPQVNPGFTPSIG